MLPTNTLITIIISILASDKQMFWSYILVYIFFGTGSNFINTTSKVKKYTRNERIGCRARLKKYGNKTLSEYFNSCMAAPDIVSLKPEL